jgi:hypothetical protein
MQYAISWRTEEAACTYGLITSAFTTMWLSAAGAARRRRENETITEKTQALRQWPLEGVANIAAAWRGVMKIGLIIETVASIRHQRK